MVEQFEAAAPAFVDVTARRGDLGVERVGQRYRSDIVVVTKEGECGSQVGIDALRFAQLEIDQPAARQRHRPCTFARCTLAPKGVVEPALGFDGGPS